MNSFHIYYTSEAYADVHPDNTNSSFRNSINLKELPNINTERIITAAVTSFTFTLRDRVHADFQLALRSSYPLDPCIRSSYFDNIIYTFVLLSSIKTTVTYTIPPSQHFYFKTTKENLSVAKFEIIDLKTNEPLELINGSIDCTLVEIVVKPQIMNNFAIVLESNDKFSSEFHPENSNMDFTIVLPTQQELQGETWMVNLKGIQISSAIWNIQDDSFTMKYQRYFTKFSDGTIDLVKNIEIKVTPGYYSSRKEVIDFLNMKFRASGFGTEARFVYFQDSTRFKGAQTFDSTKFNRNKSISNWTLSPKLANFLGFSIDKETEVTFNLMTDNNWSSNWEGNLNIGIPSNLFVHMDLLHSRIVGRKHFPILQLLNLNRQQAKSKILHFIIRENNSAKLKTKLFSKMNIKITNFNGEVIKANNDFPSILHLNFTNFT